MFYWCFLLLLAWQPSNGLKLLNTQIQYGLHNINKSYVCYDDVGCFTIDAPFFHLPHRPVPAPEDPAVLEAYLDFFNTSHRENGTRIELTGKLSIGNFDHTKELTIFLVGCFDDHDPKWAYHFKDALLSRMDVNVFIFGTNVKRQSILQNVSNLRGLGYQVARFIKYLQVHFGLKPDKKAWVVGFGCGAHMAAYTGRRVILHRITGLDPSNFLFEGEDPRVRLGRSDALYVDVHHTDASQFMAGLGSGYVQPIGHIDFYYNGGFHQPGCGTKKAIPLTAQKEKYYNCDHERAHLYFKQAIILQNDNYFLWGRNVTTENYIQSQSDDGKDGIRLIIAALLRDQCDPKRCVAVGVDSVKNPGRGIKVVTTMPYEPFYSTVDQTDRERFWLFFFDEVVVRWLHSMSPKSSYADPPVTVLPKPKKTCYRENNLVYPWTLGCFNQTPPWVIQKSRPISPPNPPSMQRIEAWFYSRTTRNKTYKMPLYPRVPSDMADVPFYSEKMTFLVIHGFYNSANEPWIAPMKDALLNASDANVIIANWGGGSVTLDYLQAAGNLRLASRVYSNLLQQLIDHEGLNVTRIHLIGHSLGAHIAGLIAKSIPGIFQITALDPAQPWFEAADPSVKIVKEDASFVVGVHSDAPPFLPDLGFGLAKEVGHVDFYINGGFKQPKCVMPTVELNTPNFTNIFDLAKPFTQIFVTLVLCPHQSAVDVYTEAVSRRACMFWGRAIKMTNMVASSHLSADGNPFEGVLFKAAVDNECTPTSCSPLGLDTYFWPARGTFVVITRSTSPYCIFESQTQTVQKTMLVVPTIMLTLKHREEFLPGATSIKNRTSIVPLPWILQVFETTDFTGLALLLTFKFIRPLYEILNLDMSWGAFPFQTLVFFWGKYVNKLISGRSFYFHQNLLLAHIRDIERNRGIEVLQ